MRIINLTASNIKRLKAVEITPEGDLVVVSGKNGAGKSSVLDSITMALGGKGTHCPEPVRKGAKRGEVVCDLGDLVVTRTFTAGGGGSLVVKTKDGAVKASPQTILDELVGRLTFDPLEFSRMKAKDQAETIRSVAGLDFSSLEQAKAEAYEKRTEINREAKALKARIDSAHGPFEVPEKEVSLEDLMARLREGRRVNEQNAETVRELRAKNDLCDRLEEERRGVLSQIRDLEAKLEEWNEKGLQVMAALDAAKKDAEGSVLAVAKLVDVDLSAVEGEIAGLQETNAKIAANRERTELEKALRGKERMSDLLSQTLADLEEERVRVIAGAALPVPGLGFTEDGGLTMNGVPFEQASQAEQLRVSIAVGMAANPKLRVMMIRDGSLLDNDSMGIVARMAEENDTQLWIERIEQDAHTSVVIEDGEVV
jgi:hypothetical protein